MKENSNCTHIARERERARLPRYKEIPGRPLPLLPEGNAEGGPPRPHEKLQRNTPEEAIDLPEFRKIAAARRIFVSLAVKYLRPLQKKISGNLEKTTRKLQENYRKSKTQIYYTKLQKNYKKTTEKLQKNYRKTT